jgi:hypothetical protein
MPFSTWTSEDNPNKALIFMTLAVAKSRHLGRLLASTIILVSQIAPVTDRQIQMIGTPPLLLVF